VRTVNSLQVHLDCIQWAVSTFDDKHGWHIIWLGWSPAPDYASRAVVVLVLSKMRTPPTVSASQPIYHKYVKSTTFFSVTF